MQRTTFLHAPICALTSQMTHTSSPPGTPAPPASFAQTPQPDNTRWTGAKAGAFLKALARTGKVAPSARAVGMTRQSAYRLRARAPKFAELWELAMAEAQRTRALEARAGRGRKAVHPLLAKAAPAGNRQGPRA